MTTRDRIVELLRGLPLADGQDALAGGWADHVMLAAALGGVNERPWFRYAGRQGAGEELRQVASLANELGIAIRGLRRESLDAMKRAGSINPHVLAEPLVAIIQAADSGAELLSDPSAEFDTAPPGSGERKVKAHQVATALGRAYQALTGKRPTIVNPARGPARGIYLRLVTEAFRALGITDRPEPSAKRAAAQAREKQRAKSAA